MLHPAGHHFHIRMNPGGSVEDRCKSANANCRESYIERQRLRNKTIIWVISISFFVVIVILIALFAWLGAHNWFKSEDD